LLPATLLFIVGLESCFFPCCYLFGMLTVYVALSLTFTFLSLLTGNVPASCTQLFRAMTVAREKEIAFSTYGWSICQCTSKRSVGNPALNVSVKIGRASCRERHGINDDACTWNMRIGIIRRKDRL